MNRRRAIIVWPRPFSHLFGLKCTDMAITRNYRYRDVDLLEMAEVIKLHFEKYEEKFRRYDAHLSADWLGALIQRAKEQSIDDFVRGKVTRYTREFRSLSEDLHAQLRLLQYYVMSASDEDSVALFAFMLGSYGAKRRRKSSYLLWINSFAQLLTEHRKALEAAGAPEAIIDAFLSKAAALQVCQDNQHTSKSGRSSSARARIKAANDLYAGLKRLEYLASAIFEEEEIPFAFFKLPSGGGKRPAKKRQPAASAVAASEVVAEEVMPPLREQKPVTKPASPTINIPASPDDPRNTTLPTDWEYESPWQKDTGG